MMNKDMEKFAIQSPEAELEKQLIEQYLLNQGYTLETVEQLSMEEHKRIMAGASTYASTKLAEVEDRAHLVHGLHGRTGT
jgi:hypothetical protein